MSEVRLLLWEHQFDEAVNVLKTTDLSCVDGLKKNCPLSRLAQFHSAKGFPPDVLHAVLEGIIPVELSTSFRCDC